MTGTSRNKKKSAIVGGTIALVASLFGVLAFGAWLAMLIAGAFAANSEFVNYAPGFWETFFGLWVIGIIGGAFNSTRINLERDK
jgi:cytochrome c biogenesis protein CcdA